MRISLILILAGIGALLGLLGLDAAAALAASGQGQRMRQLSERQEKGQEAREEAKAKAAQAKERREERKEDAREKAEERREAAQEKREAAREDREASQRRVQERQRNQAQRIHHGIRKGYLTKDEVQQLKAQQQEIHSLAGQFHDDGKITKDEAQTLRQSLDRASQCIWAQKHDTEGNQMAVYRLGKDVFAKDNFVNDLQREDLSNDQARAYANDFHTMLDLKRKLSSEDLSEAERAQAQEQYDDLLNTYFEVRESEQSER